LNEERFKWMSFYFYCSYSETNRDNDKKTMELYNLAAYNYA